jgi:hypothetical protein
MRVPLQGCQKSECRLPCVWVTWTNCALCPLLAVSCGDTGLGLLTLTVSSPRMDCRLNCTWTFTFTPPSTFMARCFVMCWDSFTFYLSLFLGFAVCASVTGQHKREQNFPWSKSFRPLCHKRLWRTLADHWFKWSCLHTATRLSTGSLRRATNARGKGAWKPPLH